MGIRALQQHAEKILAILARHGHAHAEAALRTADQQLEHEHLRCSALEAIQQQCHVRWLGDVHVPSVSWPVWLDMLDTLKQKAKHEQATLQESGKT